jgi:hypothetical protein
MPFPTGLLIRYPEEQIAVIIYAASLIAAGLSLDLMWWYATRNHHLISQHLEPDLISSVHRRILTAPVAYLLAIGVSFISVNAADLIFALTVVYYMLPSNFDPLHHRAVHRSQAGEVTLPDQTIGTTDEHR